MDQYFGLIPDLDKDCFLDFLKTCFLKRVNFPRYNNLNDIKHYKNFYQSFNFNLRIKNQTSSWSFTEYSKMILCQYMVSKVISEGVTMKLNKLIY